MLKTAFFRLLLCTSYNYHTPNKPMRKAYFYRFRYFTSVANLSRGFVLIACNNGTYGKECNNTCGYCLDQDECHHINGTCVKGCDPGYIGDLCKTGTYTDRYWYICVHTYFDAVLAKLYDYKQC